MTTATVTAIEPTTAEQVSYSDKHALQEWEIRERTQRRVEYEYDRALYMYVLFNAGPDVVHLLGHILGKTAAEIEGDMENAKS